MAKSKEQKASLLNKYKDLITTHKGFLLIKSDDINTVTITDLKMKLQETDSDYTVIKNTLFKIALQELNQPVELQNFDGPTAVITLNEDPTIQAKLLKELQKTTEKLPAKAGIFEGEYLTEEMIAQLAAIPSKEELLSKLLNSMNAPVSGMINTLTGNIRNFVLVLKGLSEKTA